jgi:hypothetical protein
MRRHLTYANVMSTLAVFLAVGGGAAYAANTVFSTDIVDGEVKTPDIASSAVTTGKIGNNQVFSSNVRDDTLPNGGLTAVDLAPGSVGSDEIADAAVTNAKIGDGAVTSAKIGDAAVTNFKLGSGAVTHSKLGPNSIDGSNVVANSLSLSDILGADKSGAITFSRAANTCGDLNLGVSGAQVGQVVLFSFTGATAIPATVVFGGVRVTAPNTVVVKICNVGSSAVSVSNLGIRVVTFG